MLRPVLLSVVLSAVHVHSQSPAYTLDAATSPGGSIAGVLQGRAAQLFVVCLDVDGGPRNVLGETLYLGLTPALLVLDAGALDASGQRRLSLPVPPTRALNGIPFFSQGVVLEARSPNGFLASNGQSFGIHSASAALVETFLDPVRAGYTGSFDAQVTGRLQGGAVRTRTKSTVDPQGALFGQPVQGALNPSGARQQVVLRALDLGATGEEELVTAIRWRPFGGQVAQDVFMNFVLELGHSHVVPDYTIDRFIALPLFPFSGLKSVFAANHKPGDPIGVRRIASGPYQINPADLRADGYLGFPAMVSPYPYNGKDSLVLDQKMHPSPVSSGRNGQEVRLMIPTSPDPWARASDFGSASRNVDPDQSVVARTGDNALPDYQFDFARVTTTATSGFIRSPGARNDYQAPIVAASVPAGASYTIEYRGAMDAAGSGATQWSPVVDVADGLGFLQLRVTFTGSLATREVPSIDTLIVPVD